MGVKVNNLLIAILFALLLLNNETTEAHEVESVHYSQSAVYLIAEKIPLPLIDQLKEYLVIHSQGIDKDFAGCIIEEESKWDYKAQNRNSTAYGLAQFLDGTFNTTNIRAGKDWDRESPYHQIEMFIWFLKEDGPTHWQVYNMGLC